MENAYALRDTKEFCEYLTQRTAHLSSFDVCRCEEACVQGFNCTQSQGFRDPYEESSSAGVALIVLGFSVMTLAVVFLFLYKFKHRFVKNDLNFVTYRAERPSTSDDFENPMYLPANDSVLGRTQTANNIKVLNNDLNISVKKSNIERANLAKQASYAKESSSCYRGDEDLPLGACGGGNDYDLKLDLKNRQLEAEAASVPINRASNVSDVEALDSR